MKKSSVLIAIGISSIISGIIISIATFYPVLKVEVNYQLEQVQKNTDTKRVIVPRDLKFGIVIPKIAANASVIPNVNPFKASEYQVALSQGIAHALNTSLPGEPGNIFLFSHSAVNFYEANRFNSIFYLLDKLENGDEIDLYYNQVNFKYQVLAKKIVNAGEVDYLRGSQSDQTLTLMTCWPPGTTFKRLVVIAKR